MKNRFEDEPLDEELEPIADVLSLDLDEDDMEFLQEVNFEDPEELPDWEDNDDVDFEDDSE